MTRAVERLRGQRAVILVGIRLDPFVVQARLKTTTYFSGRNPQAASPLLRGRVRLSAVAVGVGAVGIDLIAAGDGGEAVLSSERSVFFRCRGGSP